MASPSGYLYREMARQVRSFLRSPGARPVRFALTGGSGALLQLLTLKLLLDAGWHALPANGVAFLLSAQLNFALSTLFTWWDRGTSLPLWRRWLVFHGAISSMAVVNMLVFAAARVALPDLAAAASGTAVAAIGNFFIGDRLVFRAGGRGVGAADAQDVAA